MACHIHVIYILTLVVACKFFNTAYFYDKSIQLYVLGKVLQYGKKTTPSLTQHNTSALYVASVSLNCLRAITFCCSCALSVLLCFLEVFHQVVPLANVTV